MEFGVGQVGVLCCVLPLFVWALVLWCNILILDLFSDSVFQVESELL